ncbi:phage antirepressor N-terminal domain-containing protein [Klebsiella aerogenes]|uniref:phage antirepressor N-terminal domain-containing protein n=1 Tax=Klebsiella aerogenes TaxID=548 RepID=UPI001D18B760|nr:phage antirepressor N-terminal domain-containing protein [Klebsiella aerogenes]
MNSLATADRTINVPFHGAHLYIVNHNGEPYTPMKPIVEGMGLDWKSQFRKLNQRFKTCVVEMTIQLPGDTQRRSIICLALRKLAGWLSTISPNKVRSEIRDKVIQYQEECDDVLYEYWTKGQVINPRKTVKTTPGKITSDQQEAIKQLVLTRGHALPKENQVRAIITMWSSLKSHFGCSYKDINEEQFTEALSLAARVPLEGELLNKQEPSPVMPMIPFSANGEVIFTFRDGYIVSATAVKPNEFLTSLEGHTEMLLRRGYVVCHHKKLRTAQIDFIGQMCDESARLEAEWTLANRHRR